MTRTTLSIVAGLVVIGGLAFAFRAEPPIGGPDIQADTVVQFNTSTQQFDTLTYGCWNTFKGNTGTYDVVLTTTTYKALSTTKNPPKPTSQADKWVSSYCGYR